MTYRQAQRHKQSVTMTQGGEGRAQLWRILGPLAITKVEESDENFLRIKTSVVFLEYVGGKCQEMVLEM